MEQVMSFEKMLSTYPETHRKVNLIYDLLTKQADREPDRLMTIEELINYLPEHPARQTCYGWVNDRLAPFEKHGKRLYFRKSTIDQWLSNGRQMKGL
jgi:hypothetical protein